MVPSCSRSASALRTAPRLAPWALANSDSLGDFWPASRTPDAISDRRAAVIRSAGPPISASLPATNRPTPRRDSILPDDSSSRRAIRAVPIEQPYICASADSEGMRPSENRPAAISSRIVPATRSKSTSPNCRRSPRTKRPRPGTTSIKWSLSSTPSARRAVTRETFHRALTSASEGMDAPGASAPDAIASRNQSAIWRYPAPPTALSTTCLPRCRTRGYRSGYAANVEPATGARRGGRVTERMFCGTTSVMPSALVDEP
jgi:hypothetical protein